MRSALDGEGLANAARGETHGALADPLHVPRKDGHGVIDLVGPQRGENGAVVVIGAGFPIGSPGREEETCAHRVQVIYGCEKAWHVAGCDDGPMEGAIGFFPGADVARTIARQGRLFGAIENGRREAWGSMAEGKAFERSAHLGHFADGREIERGDADTPARLANGEPLRFEPAKRFAHRHMACAELVGDMVLPQASTRLDGPGDNAVGKRPGDPSSYGVIAICVHR